jgi:CheY-like chemotaxis protein/Tfp pilus assembly protein PilZ
LAVSNGNFPRVTLVLEVQFADHATLAHAWAEDLCGAGLVVSTDHGFQEGEAVLLVVSAPGMREPMRADARVASVRAAHGGKPASVVLQLGTLPPPARGAGALPSERRAGPLHILMVDDNPHTVRMYTHALKRMAADTGTEVVVETAASGQEAWERLGRSPPVDLVTTDLFMPVMDGFALLERLRSQSTLRDTPVLVVSGADRRDLDRALALGARGVVEKPVRINEIVASVRSLLRLG